MRYKEYYEEELRKALEAKEAEAWKNFYNKTLPKRLGEFEKSFPGSLDELEVALTGRERFLVSCQKKEVETALDVEKGRLMQSYLEDAIERLDHMKSTPEKEEKSLASEIIADQSAEIEKLKAELQDKQENLDICAGLADQYMYRQRIVECTLKLKDEKLLKCAYTYMKKLTEGEE